MSRPVLIGLIGYTGAGKASVGDALVRCGYRRIAFADKVRQLASQLGRCAPDGSDAVPALMTDDDVARLRRAAQDVLGEDVWLDASLPRVSTPFGRSSMSDDDPVVVVDVESVNEERRIRNLGGVIWRVVRPGVGPADDAEAERIAALRSDATVCNTGTLSELQSVVEYMLDSWGEPLPDLISEPAGA